MPPYEQVRPGDLITADLMNTLLDRVTALEARLDAMEDPEPDDGSLAITRLIPTGTASDPLEVGQQLRILGRNFGHSVGALRVFFDSTLVTAYEEASDTAVVVEVPRSLTVPQGGRDVTLTVTNGVTYETRTVTVLPVQVALSGDVDVFWNDDISPNPDPNPVPEPSDTDPPTVTFAYRVRSRASLPTTFTISPTVSVAEWQAGAEVLDGDGAVLGNRRIALDPFEEAEFSVRLTLTETSATSFTLNVTASSGNVVGFLNRPFEVGEAVEEGDPEIDLVLTDFTVFNETTGQPAPEGGSHDSTSGAIEVAEGHAAFLTYAATFEVSTTYDVTVESSDPGEWAVQLTEPSSADPGAGTYDESEETPPVNEAPAFFVRPLTGAASPAELTFTIRRAGETRSQTRRYAVSLQS